MDRAKLTDLIEASDLDGLIRFVDGVCAADEYEALEEIRHRCTEAVERGKEVWGIAHFAAYRAALEAPGPIAAAVVEEGAGRTGLGPLWEVAASTHRWDELGPHVEEPKMRALVAYERSIRGDAIGAPPADFLDIPIQVQSWEPRYALATYRSDEADFPSPPPPACSTKLDARAYRTFKDPESEDALFELVRAWVDESRGTFATATVEGPAEDAIAAVSPADVSFTEVNRADALAHMAWAGASGGSAGTRRGTPVGRANAWAAVATMADLDFPGEPEAIGEAASRFRWLMWEDRGIAAGWLLNVAIEDQAAGLSWAIRALDRGEDGSAS